MNRVEAYAHMLQGGKVTHPLIRGGCWHMLDNRHIVIDNGVHDFTSEFLRFVQYKEGWEIYASTDR